MVEGRQNEHQSTHIESKQPFFQICTCKKVRKRERERDKYLQMNTTPGLLIYYLCISWVSSLLLEWAQWCNQTYLIFLYVHRIHMTIQKDGIKGGESHHSTCSKIAVKVNFDSTNRILVLECGIQKLSLIKNCVNASYCTHPYEIQT